LRVAPEREELLAKNFLNLAQIFFNHQPRVLYTHLAFAVADRPRKYLKVASRANQVGAKVMSSAVNE
jgi:hypothetical protein